MSDIFNLQQEEQQEEYDASSGTSDPTISTTTSDPIQVQIQALSGQVTNLNDSFDQYRQSSLIGLCCLAAVIVVLIFVIVFLVFWIKRLQRLVRAIDPLSRYKQVRPSTFIRPRERQETPSFGTKHLGKYDSGNNAYSETYDNNNANRNNSNDPYEGPQNVKGRHVAPLPNNNDKTSLENLNFSNWNPAGPRNNQQSSFLNQPRPQVNLVKRTPSANNHGPPYNDMGNQYY